LPSFKPASEKIVPVAPHATALFYDRLLQKLPEVRSLFKGKMDDQGRKLMATLATVVHNLDQLDAVLPPRESVPL
jgi:hemoglobin-like flavoprotein